MRAKEITEIIKIPASQFNPRKSWMPSIDSSRENKFKRLPGGSGLLYDVLRRGSDELEIHIAKKVTVPSTVWVDLELAGVLTVDKNQNFPLANAHQVVSIVVDPDYRGQGIGKALYGIYLSILKYPLLAGGDQTPGGRKNWLSLASIPGVEVRGYVPIRDEYFSGRDSQGKMTDRQQKKFDQLIDNVMNMGGEYLGKKNNIHYFGFDVEPGTGELEPAVKNQLKLYGYHDLVNPGLYAVWTGK